MAFPTGPDIGIGESHQEGGKNWIWDGTKWVLLSVNNVSVKKIGELTDVTDDNIAEKEGQLLSWDPAKQDSDGEMGAWVRKDKSEVSGVEILDDLADVEIKESEDKLGPAYGYYIQDDPVVENGWGRYRVDVQNKTVEVHIRDIDGNTVEDLLKADPSGSTGHRLAWYDGTWNAEATLLSKTQATSYSYIFTYREEEIVNRLYNTGVSKLFTIQSNEFRGLAHNTVLTYKVDADSQEGKWRPAFMQGAGGNANITLSEFPPPEPDFEDIWVDSTNYYMYVWTPVGNPDLMRGTWVAMTGPGGVDGGSDIVNDSTVTIVPSRGFSVQSGGSFTLNQKKNHVIQMSPSSTVELDGAPPAIEDRQISDIWIDTKDYKMYVWNGTEWVALTGDQSGEGSGGAGFNYIPCQLDGGRADQLFCADDGFNIDGGRAQQVYCENDDLYSSMRPGVIITDNTAPVTSAGALSRDSSGSDGSGSGSDGEYPVGPPPNPKKGDLWFDSSTLELRIWYITESSSGRWVSAVNPGMDVPLPPDPDPIPVRISGPNSSIANIASDHFSCIIGSNLINPFFSWGTTDPDAYIQKIGNGLNVVDIVFTSPGTHKVVCTVRADNLSEPYFDELKVVVSETPDNVPIIYDVLVRFFTGDPNGNRFVVNGKQQPYITFVRGQKYVFRQSDSSNYQYPMRLYTNPERTEVFLDGVILGENYLEIQCPADAPSVLYYDSPESEIDMGNIIYVAGIYQFVDNKDPIYLPIITSRVYDYESTDFDNLSPQKEGAFFAHTSDSYTAPLDDVDYEPYSTWTHFYFNNLIDKGGADVPSWDDILTVPSNPTDPDELRTTIQITDGDGVGFLYGVVGPAIPIDGDPNGGVTIEVEALTVGMDSANISVTDNREVSVVFTTPPVII